MIRIYPLNGLLMQTRGDMHAHLRERFHLAEHCPASASSHFLPHSFSE